MLPDGGFSGRPAQGDDRMADLVSPSVPSPSRRARGVHRRPRGAHRAPFSSGRPEAVAAVVTQAVTAGCSFLLQIVAAHRLGVAGLGGYALCVALLVTATAVYTGWVGDSLTVLDRQQPRIREALVASALTAWLVSAVVGGGVVLLLGVGSTQTALVFAALVVGWLAEETGRRLLMARLEMWSLVLNDVTYAVVTFLALAVLSRTGIGLTVGTLLGAMGIGAMAAVLTALVQLPRAEWGTLRPGLRGLRELSSFAAWRSLQATLRPASLLLVRVLVANLMSFAALGLLEAARLVLAPAQTVINSAGNFLLPSFAAAERRDTGIGRRLAERAVRVLVVVTVLVGLLAAALRGPLGALLTGGGFALSAVCIVGWAAYLATWAATLPFVAELVARRRSREVFVARLVDSAVGLALAAGALILGAGYAVIPWLLSVGGVVAAWWVRRLALRTRGSAAAPSPDRGRLGPARLS
jgi:O-antigen/teichoic acid export membrane protein